jgi:uncharacterized protein YndB with AHSA1/START domain
VTPQVRLERAYRAPISRVFRALTDPAELVRWWGPPDARTSAAEIDLRVGGACRWVMHPHGQRAVLHGRIIELDPPRLLVMAHHWEGDDAETVVTLRLTDLGDRTRLELVHSRLPATLDPEEFTRWWTAALGCLEHHLMTSHHPGIVRRVHTERISEPSPEARAPKTGCPGARHKTGRQGIMPSTRLI